jgi:hypothetical protein
MTQLFKEFLRSEPALAKSLGLCLALVVGIHLLPKPESPDNTLRLLLVFAYFGAWFALARLLGGPRQAAIQRFVRQLFRDDGEELQRSSQSIAFRVNSALDILSALMTFCVAAVGLSVLSVRDKPWIDFLEPFHGLFVWGYRLGFAGLLLFPYYYAGGIAEIINRLKLLREEISIGGRGGSQGGRPLAVTTASRFDAAGLTLTWNNLRRNVVVFGEIGSGKTWCVLNTLLDGLVASASHPWNNHSCGVLLLDPTGDFREKTHSLCRRLGRSADLVELDPEKPDVARWNPLDCDDDEFEVSKRFAAVMSALDPEASKGEAFWSSSAEKFLLNALALCRLTNPPEQPPSLEDIYQLAMSPARIRERCARLDLHSADKRVDNCLAFFSAEWLEYAPELRGSIQAHVTNMLQPFLIPPYDKVFAGRSSFRLSQIVEEGKIVYFNIPVATREVMARIVCTLAKLEFYNDILKPKNIEKKRATLFFCDEFQVFFTTMAGRGDADFFARSRKSNHVNVIACQNRPSLEKEAPREEVVDNLLGNVGMKIFLRNSERKTNEWASDLFGEKIVGTVSGGSGGSSGAKFQLPGHNVTGGQERIKRVPPERFSRLASPSKETEIRWAESIIHVTGAEAEGSDMKTIPEIKYRWLGHDL